MKKIFIILPFKESLNKNNAGAVSIFVKDTTRYSKYKKYIKIISSADFKEEKLYKNRNYILNFCKKFKKTQIDIIEIHNRPEYLHHVRKFFPNTKIKIFFHNDPLSIRNSKTKEEREFIIKNSDQIIFISNWIQKQFFKELKNINISFTRVIHHGVKKNKNIKLNNKIKNILFVGKLNKNKGYHIFCKVASMFKKIDPSWNFISIGNESRKEIFPINNTVKELGFLTNEKVMKYYEKSEIVIANSVWDEPLGRVPIEASSRKCLPIISNKGGLSDSKKIAFTLKYNSSNEILKFLKTITSNKQLRQKKQNLFYNNNDFDIIKISKEIDELRNELLINTKKNNLIKNKKILHIANFNENSDGRLFYSFANKLNNGFIKNEHIVQTISDRNYLKSNKSFFNPFNNVKKFNKKILNTLINFSPDMLLLGHVFNIDKEVFNYCRKNNIKICAWYIDSVSKEFLKGTQNKNFIYNLNNIDHYFITSSPIIFKNHKYFKKINFIPNPIDSSIDSLVNFENKHLEFDIFAAISHGQNRGILKKGKYDQREKILKYLTVELPESKFALFGVDEFEPIWGANFFHFLSKSKIGINISRGSYQKLYSSDRISSLIGNGLLVFMDQKTEFKKLFNNKEIVFYKNKKDLLNKLKFFLKNDKIRIDYAKSAYKKYHKYMNNKIIANYILNCSDIIKTVNPYWHNMI